MRRFILYLAGAVACLSVGAFFVVVLDNLSPAKGVPEPPVQAEKNVVVPAETGTQSGLDSRFRGNDGRDVEGGKPATILFMGDMMLGRSVAALIAKQGNGYPFAKIKETVAAADYAVANLEGPVTARNQAPDNRMVFHFDPSLAATLAADGFDAFSLANNHGLDQGSKGQADTKKNLESAGLAYFGDASTDTGRILYVTVGGKNLALIGLHDVYRKVDPAVVAGEIVEAKKSADLVVVYPHWGDEYRHDRNAREAELAHALVDAGADIIVGGHPHVVEGIEVYKGKPIFYSLGNLVFDQYFSVETQEGLAVRLNLAADGAMSFDLLPYEIPQSQPVFAQGEKKAKMLQDIASWSDPILGEEIRAGYLKIIPADSNVSVSGV